MAISRMAGILTLGTLLCSGTAVASQEALSSPAPASAEELRECLDANRLRGTYVGSFEVETRIKGVLNRIVSGRIYLQVEDGVYESTLQIKSPSDMAGVSYLIRETDEAAEAFIRVPALKRTRRLKMRDEDETLPGLPISHADVRQIYLQFERGADSYPQQLQGRAIDEVGFLAESDELTSYRRVQTWLDASSCLPVRIELDRPSGIAVMARFDPAHFAQLDGAWVPTAAVIGSSDGNQLNLRLSRLQRGLDISSRLFHPGTFYY